MWHHSRMKVTVNEIEGVARVLFQHLRATRQTEFDIQEDYYWDIFPENLYDPLRDPVVKEMGIGQLSEDWEKCLGLLSDDPALVGYGLVWLAAIMKRCGEMTNC